MPIIVYKTVHTTGKSHPGGDSGGLFSASKESIPFMVASPATRPTSRGIARQIRKRFVREVKRKHLLGGCNYRIQAAWNYACFLGNPREKNCVKNCQKTRKSLRFSVDGPLFLWYNNRVFLCFGTEEKRLYKNDVLCIFMHFCFAERACAFCRNERRFGDGICAQIPWNIKGFRFLKISAKNFEKSFKIPLTKQKPCCIICAYFIKH